MAARANAPPTARSHIAITKDVYGHLVEEDKRAAAESMSGVLFGARPRRAKVVVAPI